MLQGHMGGTFRPKLVTPAYFLTIFGAGWILELIFEAKMSIFSVFRVGLRQRLAQRRGGRQASKALVQVFYQQYSTPCYLCRGAADLQADASAADPSSIR